VGSMELTFLDPKTNSPKTQGATKLSVIQRHLTTQVELELLGDSCTAHNTAQHSAVPVDCVKHSSRQSLSLGTAASIMSAACCSELLRPAFPGCFLCV
jgi:hypothetical protein